ncbi:MAG: hypothetical protein K2X39_10095, partial [Silvanigrellaceae bacterium]|nr:hypothetical protein [Silvanigrellaceae bacterium]
AHALPFFTYQTEPSCISLPAVFLDELRFPTNKQKVFVFECRSGYVLSAVINQLLKLFQIDNPTLLPPWLCFLPTTHTALLALSSLGMSHRIYLQNEF